MKTSLARHPSRRSPHAAAARPDPAAGARGWLVAAQANVARALAERLGPAGGRSVDPQWAAALDELAAYTLRPAKRIRPALLLVGYGLARGDAPPPAAVWEFAAGIEVLQSFMLIHDDVADGAEVRRGGPALHRRLGDGRLGEQLAIVVGDHAFARALRLMLGSALPGTAAAVRYYLRALEETAAGQFLDLAQVPLRETTPMRTLRVACLKTARAGFAAPLVAGVLLGRGDRALRRAVERIGDQLGLAFQLRDDLLALFGDAGVVGKTTTDLGEGKATYPVVAAYLRAPADGRRALERLWADRRDDADALSRARSLVEAYGGRRAAERAAARAARVARQAVRRLPATGGFRALLAGLIEALARREL
jgi:geranylgeranyl diphosphate synthase type I